MPAYVIAQIDIHDAEGYQAYLDGFPPSFARHGGKVLVSSSMPMQILEGDWAKPGTVVLQFPDVKAARAWYADPDYAGIAAIRHLTASTNLVLIDATA